MSSSVKQPALKNTYSTSPNIHAAINKMLIANGVSNFGWVIIDGAYAGLTFTLPVGGKSLSFYYDARILAVRRVLLAQARTPLQERKARARAYQVAWANVRDWLAAQFALIRLGQADTAEVFLPYLLADGEHTLYALMQQQQFQALPPGGQTHVSIE